jgi:RsiW-degrading membrane proteinase PrsW (M82 family)
LNDPIAVPLALVPVLAFLAVLRGADVYRLVPARAALRSVAIGSVVAVLAALLNGAIRESADVSLETMTRYVAPVVEESVKAAWIAWIVRTHRCGFQVDAAIHGFAVGAGFAVVENVYYLLNVSDAPIVLWVVRGFGTAVMHGGATAIFAILFKEIVDRAPERSAVLGGLPLAIAAVLHAVYNHFPLPPLLGTLVLLVTFPLLTLAVLVYSERQTRRWVYTGFDSDAEMLVVLLEGRLPESPLGSYLESIRRSFPPDVMADMVAYLQLGLELSLVAKGTLLAREAGVEVPPDEELREKLDEFRWLESRLGAAGRRALSPVVRRSAHDVWQILALDDADRGLVGQAR